MVVKLHFNHFLNNTRCRPHNFFVTLCFKNVINACPYKFKFQDNHEYKFIYSSVLLQNLQTYARNFLMQERDFH